MSEEITKCDYCDSQNYTILNPEVKSEPKTIVSFKAKCNDCDKEFEFRDLSLWGQEQRRKGRIWLIFLIIRYSLIEKRN